MVQRMMQKHKKIENKPMTYDWCLLCYICLITLLLLRLYLILYSNDMHIIKLKMHRLQLSFPILTNLDFTPSNYNEQWKTAEAAGSVLYWLFLAS